MVGSGGGRRSWSFGKMTMCIPSRHQAHSVPLLLACSGLTLLALSASSALNGPTNLWKFNAHVEDGGELTMTAVMLDVNNPPTDYRPQVPGGDVSHNWELDLEAPARLLFHTPTNNYVGMKYTAGYYRGPIYAAPASRGRFTHTNLNDTNCVSIFSNRARSELIAAVDHGFIYTSTNWGMTWTVITAPGPHEFPLSRAPDGSGFCAHASIEPSAPAVAGVSGTNESLSDWYAVASSADGSQLAVSASTSQPAPVLNIRRSPAGVTIAWPAQYKSFRLEHTTNPSYGLWAPVTNSVHQVGDENGMVLSPEMDGQFFRLKAR